MNLAQGCQGLMLLEGEKLENVPGDPGKLTKNGVTQAAYDRFRDRKGLPRQSVALMTSAETIELYGEDYWAPAGCDHLTDGLDFIHFQWVVNHGVSSSLRCLKLAIYGRPQLGDIDGSLNAKNLAELKKWGVTGLVQERYLAIQSATYDRIAQAHAAGEAPGLLKFFNGWENRIQRVRDIVAGRPLSV